MFLVMMCSFRKGLIRLPAATVITTNRAAQRGEGHLNFRITYQAMKKTTARGSETNWALVASLALSRALEFVHFGLTAKYQLPTALARYCGRGGTAKRWVRDSLILCEENNPSPRL